MNVYLLTRLTPDYGYDFYISAVVVAENADVARHMDPKTGELYSPESDEWDAFDEWVHPKYVMATEIGTAHHSYGESRKVVCANYHNG